MKKLTTSYPMKTLAFLLAVLTGLAAVVCTACGLYFSSMGYYDDPALLPDVVPNPFFHGNYSALVDEAWVLYEDEHFGVPYGFDRDFLEAQLAVENTNLRYSIFDADGKLVAGTAPVMTYEEAMEQAFVISSYSVDEAADAEGRHYTVVGMVDETLPVDDAFARATASWKNVVNARNTILYAGGAALVAFLLLIVFLCCGAGRYENAAGPEIRNLDRVPSDLYFAVVAGLAVLLCLVFFAVMPDMTGFTGFAIAGGLIGAGIGALCIAVLLSFAARIKCRTLFSNTVVWRILKLLGRFFRWCGRGVSTFVQNLPLLLRIVVSCAALWFLNAFCLGNTPLFFLALFVDLVVLLLLCRWALGLDRIKKGVASLAAGSMGTPVDTAGMRGNLLRMANELNSAQDGVQRAVSEQVKSERMKADLITNVSHDLKTPLTSIVNYVDLLKKEELPGKAAEYAAVLDRQAQRLKKLTDDLVEASKASSGALAVHLAETDVTELVNQSLAEYGERLAAAGLTPVVNLPAEPVRAEADGRLLWRVVDNLLSNAAKYAQPGTRVYVDVAAEGGSAYIRIKNVSREALNVTPEELMERFVRGDASRTTEGSGLGLSIAKDLMALEGGTLTLSIDGDLFRAEAAVPLVKNASAPELLLDRATDRD